jgi:hypothetical protein
MLLAEGLKNDTLATLVRAGFATVHVEHVRAGAEWIEVCRLHDQRRGPGDS